MTNVSPKQVIELFLFEDINNNTNHYESDGWQITWVGNNFIVRDPDGNDTGWQVQVRLGADLTPEEWDKAIADQEWDG